MNPKPPLLRTFSSTRSDSEIRQLLANQSPVDAFYRKLTRTSGFTLQYLDDLLRRVGNEDARKVYARYLPIRIVERPLEEIRVKEGEKLELVVKAQGFPRPKAIWFKGTERLGFDEEQGAIAQSPVEEVLF